MRNPTMTTGQVFSSTRTWPFFFFEEQLLLQLEIGNKLTGNKYLSTEKLIPESSLEHVGECFRSRIEQLAELFCDASE